MPLVDLHHGLGPHPELDEAVCDRALALPVLRFGDDGARRRVVDGDRDAELRGVVRDVWGLFVGKPARLRPNPSLHPTGRQSLGRPPIRSYHGAGQAGQVPPQSTPVSVPFFTPSVHEGGWQMFALQTALTQSTGYAQPSASAHGPQLPPQS
jgi:hypothetical protein